MDMDMQGHQTRAALGYLAAASEKPYQYMYEPPDARPWDNYTFDPREVRIRDARIAGGDLGLEQSGFELRWQPSGVRDFYDAGEVTRQYYAELEATALELSGGIRAVVFDHQWRRREDARPPLGFGRSGDGSKPSAVGRVHNDYTEVSGRRRPRMVLDNAVDDHPFLILNFWRPLLAPALDAPLALCDARSFPARDWIAADLIYRERIGEIYLARYAEEHAWYYYPAMTPDEMLVFKSFDSRFDCPARMTPHCAFDDPATPPEAPPRRSIEARCLVILD